MQLYHGKLPLPGWVRIVDMIHGPIRGEPEATQANAYVYALLAETAHSGLRRAMGAAADPILGARLPVGALWAIWEQAALGQQPVSLSFEGSEVWRRVQVRYAGHPLYRDRLRLVPYPVPPE